MYNSNDDFRKKYSVVENNTATKRKLKNKPSKKNLKLRAAAGLAAGLVALGMVGCGNKERVPEVNQSGTITYSSTLTEEEKIENAVKKAERDFLNKYIEAYNKEYGTNYMAFEAELCDNSIKEGIVYVVDEKLVTHGNYPALVKQQLSEYGTVTSEDGHDKVIQILASTEKGDKKVLCTYDAKTLETMYSGTDLSNFDSKLPELTELGIDKETAESIIALKFAEGVESYKSIKMRLDKYNKAVSNADKGYEIGD